MAAPLPSQQFPVAEGPMSTPWYLTFADWFRRIGGSQDITMSVSGSNLTFTVRAADGTVKTGTVALTP